MESHWGHDTNTMWSDVLERLCAAAIGACGLLKVMHWRISTIQIVSLRPLSSVQDQMVTRASPCKIIDLKGSKRMNDYLGVLKTLTMTQQGI